MCIVATNMIGVEKCYVPQSYSLYIYICTHQKYTYVIYELTTSKIGVYA